jgi:GTP-binding protein
MAAVPEEGTWMRITRAELAVIAASSKQFPDTGIPEVAFAGRSNVGKSTLINAITGRKKLAYTSSTPGKTRQIIFFRINDAFHFVDLPGYGYAKVSLAERQQFKKLVEGYFTAGRKLVGCVLLLDPRRPVGEEEVEFIRYLRDLAIRPVVVFTKWDRVKSAQRTQLLRQRQTEFAGLVKKVFCVGARTSEGVDLLWSELEHMIENEELCP